MKKVSLMALLTLASAFYCQARRKPRSARKANRAQVAQQQPQPQQPQEVISAPPVRMQRSTQAILAAKGEGLLRYVREKRKISAGINAEIQNILSQLEGGPAEQLSQQFESLKSTFPVEEPAPQVARMESMRPPIEKEDQATLIKKAQGLLRVIDSEGKISNVFAHEIDRILGQLQGPEKEKLMDEFNQRKNRLS